MSLVTLKRKTEEKYRRAAINANASASNNGNPSQGRNEGAMGSLIFDADAQRSQHSHSVASNIIRKFHNAPAYNYVHKTPIADQSAFLDRRKTDIVYVKVNSTTNSNALDINAGNARPQCATTKDVSVPCQSDRLQRLRQFQASTTNK